MCCMFVLVGGALIALFIAGYLAQRSLPPPAPKVIGIDLGKCICYHSRALWYIHCRLFHFTASIYMYMYKY